MLCLVAAACGWSPVVRAVGVRVIATLPTGGYNSGVTVGVDGNFYLVLNGPGNTFLRVSPDGTQVTTLYNQTGFPWIKGPLLRAGDGNFYGIVQQPDFDTLGEIVQLTPAGQITVIHRFVPGDADGTPDPGLTLGNDGALYGTTSYSSVNANGTVFRCGLDGTVNSLHAFTGGADGSFPGGRLTLGTDGNFYGVATNVLFRITPTGTFTTLHTFLPDGTEGNGGNPGFVQDAVGNFYGTSPGGGKEAGPGNNLGEGTVFRFTSAGQFTVLHVFTGLGTDGAGPVGPLVQAADGNFYGSTASGGNQYGGGTIFRVTPAGAVSTIFSNYGHAIVTTQAGLTLAANGDLYGLDGANRLLDVQLVSPGAVVFNNTRFIGAPYDGKALVGVSRTEGTRGAISVACSTTDGTAVAGVDYVPVSGVLQWADGDASVKTFTVPLVPRAYTGDRQFNLLLSTPTGGAALGENAAASVDLTGNVGQFQTGSGLVPIYAFGDFDSLDGGMVQRMFVGSDGNFYGTTSEGGSDSRGVTFQLTSSGSLTVLADFSFLEAGGITKGTDGNFYGTAVPDGSTTASLYRLAPGGTPVPLCDLGLPVPLSGISERSLLQTADGQIYGIIENGDQFNPGTRIFRIAADGTQTTLYTVADGFDVTLTEGADGNLYGLAHSGINYTGGFLFRLTPTGSYTRLYTFDGKNGHLPSPSGPLVAGPKGNLYGLAGSVDTAHAATLFRLKPTTGKLKSFPLSVAPGSLLLGDDGNFYGTADFGNNLAAGTTFLQLSPQGLATPLYNGALNDRSLDLSLQGSDRAFYFRSEDAPEQISRMELSTAGVPTVAIVVPAITPVSAGSTNSVTLARSGDLSVPLTVSFGLSGTAVTGLPSQDLTRSFPFPAGSYRVSIPIVSASEHEPDSQTFSGTVELKIKLLRPADGSYRFAHAYAKDNVVIEY